MQASDEATALLNLFRSSQMYLVRDKIRQVGQTRLDILAALALVQMISKTNAKIIMARSTPVPLRWLQLLEASDPRFSWAEAGRRLA